MIPISLTSFSVVFHILCKIYIRGAPPSGPLGLNQSYITALKIINLVVDQMAVYHHAAKTKNKKTTKQKKKTGPSPGSNRGPRVFK